MHVDWECLSPTLCIVYSVKLLLIKVYQVETNLNTNVSTSKQPLLITLYNAECTLGAHHQSVVFAHCLPYVWLALYNLKIAARVWACAKYVTVYFWPNFSREKHWQRAIIFAEGEVGLNFLLLETENCQNLGLCPNHGDGGSGWLGQIPHCFRISEMDGSPKWQQQKKFHTFYSCFHKDLVLGRRLDTKYEPSRHHVRDPKTWVAGWHCHPESFCVSVKFLRVTPEIALGSFRTLLKISR